MPELIELKFRYTEDEYVSAIRSYMLRGNRVTFFIMIASVVFLLGVYFLVTGSDVAITVAFLCTGAFLYGLLATSVLILPRRRFQADPKFRDEYLLGFTEDALIFKTQHIDAKVDWSFYTEALETARFYLLVYGEGGISVIPRRAFTDQKQEDLFRDLISRRVGPAGEIVRLQTDSAPEERQDYVPPAGPPDWR